MRSITLVFIALMGFTAKLAADEMLVTTVGRFATASKSVAVETQLTSEGQLAYSATFRKRKYVENIGEVISERETKGSFAVVAGEWAICLTDPDSVWIYRGNDSYARLQYDETKCLTSEAIKNSAPAALKRWVQGKKANQQTDGKTGAALPSASTPPPGGGGGSFVIVHRNHEIHRSSET